MIIEPDSINALTDAIEVYCPKQAARLDAGRVGRDIAELRHSPARVAHLFESQVLSN